MRSPHYLSKFGLQRFDSRGLIPGRGRKFCLQHNQNFMDKNFPLSEKQKVNEASKITLKHNGNYVNKSTNRSLWEFNSCYAIREIPYILNNPKFRYRVRNTAWLILIIRDINAIHTVPLYPFRVQFNIIFHLKLEFYVLLTVQPCIIL